MTDKILFIGKQSDFYCQKGAEFIQTHFTESVVIFGSRGEKLPEQIMEWSGDYIISYLSPWVLPRAILEKASKAAINFHPGPPEYPGIGCTNFAIYQEAAEFGVTCHHMNPKVDTGSIIAVHRFPLLASDSVWSLTHRAYAYILQLFYEVMIDVLKNTELRTSDETWRRKPYLRSELDELCRVTPEMSEAEKNRRIRATVFPGAPGPYMDLGTEKLDLAAT